MSQTTQNPYIAYKVREDLKPKGLDGLSEKLIDEHWKLYKGYVTNTNLLNKLVWDAADADKGLNNAEHSEIQRRLGFEYNGMVLHEYYFGALQKGSSLASSSALKLKLAEDFGGFERWKKQFVEIGKFRGVGWVVLSYDPSSKKLNNFWVTDHEVGNVAGFIPVLVMDVWEHAYVLDYGSSSAAGIGRDAYLDAFFRNINWDVVEERLKYAQTLKPIR
jgi:Fe-Mn family superoxide dismutase